MSVTFFQGRELPETFSHGGMGDGTFTEAGGAQIMSAISPWNFLTSWLATKPEAEAAAQADIARSAAQAAAANDQLLAQRNKSFEMIAIAGVGVLGILLLVVATNPKPHPPKVNGYRKRRR